MENQGLEKLLSALQTGNAHQRRAASYKLGKSKNPMVVSALINAYNDTDGSVRQNVISGLRNIGSKEALDFLDSKRIPRKITVNRGYYITIIIVIILGILVTVPYWMFFVFGVCMGVC